MLNRRQHCIEDNKLSQCSKCLCRITQLKRAQVPIRDIVWIYCACIRSLLEYASPVFHNFLPQFLHSKIEQNQRPCIRRVFSDVPYEEALKLANLETL